MHSMVSKISSMFLQIKITLCSSLWNSASGIESDRKQRVVFTISQSEAEGETKVFLQHEYMTMLSLDMLHRLQWLFDVLYSLRILIIL